MGLDAARSAKLALETCGIGTKPSKQHKSDRVGLQLHRNEELPRWKRLTACRVAERICAATDSVSTAISVGGISEGVGVAPDGIAGIVSPRFITEGITAAPHRVTTVVTVCCVSKRVCRTAYCVARIVAPRFVSIGIPAPSVGISGAIPAGSIAERVSSTTSLRSGLE